MPKYLVILHDAQDDSPAGREELKLRMCDSLKVSAKAVANIFQALPVIIRRDLELPVAEKYAQTLERLGAVVEVIEQPDRLTEDQSLHVLGDLPVPAKKSEAPAFTAEQEQELGDLEAMLDDALHLGAQRATAQPPNNVASSVPVQQKENDDDFGLALSFDDAPSVHRAPVILDMLEDESAEVSPPPPIPPPIVHKTAPPSPPAAEQPVRTATPDSNPAPEAPGDEQHSVEPPVRMGAFSSPYSGAAPPVSEPWIEPQQTKRRSLTGKQAALGAMCVFLLLSVAFGRSAMEAMLGGSRQTMQVSFDIDRLLKEQGSILGMSKSEEDAPIEITGHWVGQNEEQGVSTRMRVTELGRVMQLAGLEVNTVQPPPLTDKELVEGKPFPVWLRKFEAVNVRRQPAPAGAPPDLMFFSGSGRAYFQDGKGNERQLVEVEIQVQAPKDGVTSLDGQWILRRALQGPDPVANQVSRLSKKDFQLFYRGKASLSFEKPAIAKKIRKK